VKAEHREKMSKLPVGTKVMDRDGFKGVITLVTKYQGSVWYDVRLERGEAVRYPEDLTVI